MGAEALVRIDTHRRQLSTARTRCSCGAPTRSTTGAGPDDHGHFPLPLAAATLASSRRPHTREEMTMRWFRLLVPAFAALIGLSTLNAYAAGLVQVSSDPFTNTTSQHRTEVEPDTFAFGSTIVSAFQVGRFFNGGASDIGFATSNDGGKTFTSGFLPDTTFQSTPANLKYQRVSDPSVAFDTRDNVWMISYLGIPAALVPVDVLASRSTDGGLTCGPPLAIPADRHFNAKTCTDSPNQPTSPHHAHRSPPS